MTAVKDDLIRNNNTINWIPESIGKGRFGDWLETDQDWGISRYRYWVTPLNIWQCECGHLESVGSRQDLYEKSGDERAKTIELHRPYIDDITMKCPDCGKEIPLFGADDAVNSTNVPVLERIPLDPAVAAACDTGALAQADVPYLTKTAQILAASFGEKKNG